MKSRQELQNIWESIVEKGYSNYNSLTRCERVWFNIERLTTSGLIDYYINHEGEYNLEIIEDLEYLGFKIVGNLFREINSLFLNGIPSKDIDERNNEIYEWNDKNRSLLDENEKKFWEKADSLEIALLEHINKCIEL
jgi:hypothetical protein